MGSLFAEAHEDDVRREAVQPGGECGFAAERVNLAKELQEGFLREVLGFEGIADHAKAETVDPTGVLAVEVLEGGRVAALGAEDCGIELSGDRLERARR